MEQFTFEGCTPIISFFRIELPATQLEPGDRIAPPATSFSDTLHLIARSLPLLSLPRLLAMREEARVQPRAFPLLERCQLFKSWHLFA
jgi:hypothetical protein